MARDSDTRIVVNSPAGSHPDSRDIETVERKGRGHSDSICSAVAEAFSISLTRAYHERAGQSSGLITPCRPMTLEAAAAKSVASMWASRTEW